MLKRGQASRDGGRNLARNLERARKNKLLWSLVVKFGQNFDSVWDELSVEERGELSNEVNELESKEKHEYLAPGTLRNILEQNRQNALAVSFTSPLSLRANQRDRTGHLTPIR